MQEEKKEREGEVCRFCHTEEDSGVDSFVTPCQCKGSMRYVHMKCLADWRASSLIARDRCTLCGARYHYSVWDPARYTQLITLVVFVGFLYTIDVNALLFNDTCDISFWSNCVFLLLQSSYIVLFWSQLFTTRLSGILNDDRLSQTILFAILIGVWVMPWYKVCRLSALAVLYEVFDLLVVRFMGQPQITSFS